MRGGLATLALLATALLPASSHAAGAKPVYGKTVIVKRVSGTVEVKTPNGLVDPLTGSHLVPVGTIVEDSKGTAQVTASDNEGDLHTGRFNNAYFMVLQRRPSTGVTEIKLRGKSCYALVASGRRGGPRAHVSRHRRPYVRGGSGVAPLPVGSLQLDVRAPSNFVIVGEAASAVATDSRARFRVANACDGTHVIVKHGLVTIHRAHKPASTIGAGESELNYCGSQGRRQRFCLDIVASPHESEFNFGVWLRHFDAGRFRVCYGPPQGRQSCFGEPLDRGNVQRGGLSCLVNQGRGTFYLAFYIDGRVLGWPQFVFETSRPRSSALGADRCNAGGTAQDATTGGFSSGLSWAGG
jgi:hypothetical protein